MKLTMILALAVTISATACKTTKPAVEQPTAETPVPIPVAKQDPPMAFIPKAVVYKTNGDYNDNVAINVDANGRIISYPAPSDVSASSSALPLENGWLLDRRGGVGQNTVFLRYTYEQYAQLPTAPTLDQLRAAIIPDAKVTTVKQLPIPASEAISDPQKAINLLK